MNRQRAAVLFLGFVVIIGSLFYSFRNTDVSLNEKTPVLIILSEKPTSQHFRTSLKFYDDIKFKAEGYTSIFIIDNFEYKASLYNEITSNLNKGDTVEVWIDKELNWDVNVSVYALKYRNLDYINIRDRNTIKSRYNKYGLIVGFYGILLIFNLYIKNGIKLTFIKTTMILLLIVIGIYRITK